jgi:hypothetical protein
MINLWKKYLANFPMSLALVRNEIRHQKTGRASKNKDLVQAGLWLTGMFTV